MKCKRRSGASGFTLIETAVSLGVFALASAAVGSLLVSQIRMQTSNVTRTKAISLASKELEDLRALDYNSIPTSRTSTTTVGGVIYTVTSRAVFNSPANGVATITTTVTWTEPLGAQSYTANVLYTDITR